MNPIVSVISDTVQLAIIALVGGALTGTVMPIVMFVLKAKEDRRIREEDRAERLELARITKEGLAAVKEEGGKRENRIVDEVKKVKQVAIAGVKNAKEAFKEANGVNAKIASLGQKLVDEKSTQQ